MSIKDKKILFFAPKFFGYEKDVLDELTAQGAQVFFLPDRPSDNSLVKALYRFAPSLLYKVSNQYYDLAVKKFNQPNFDYIFIQSGEALTIDFLKKIKLKYDKAKFIFYTYDSILNKKGQLEKIKFCDISYTFDKIDADTHGINFRPLFFSEGFEKVISNESCRYDLSFVGTAHSDRYSIVSKIKNQLNKDIQFYTFLYLQAKWLYWLKKIISKDFTKSSFNDFNFLSISKKNVQEIFFNSKVILDIEHPNQTGLTMRTFESLGAKKKLITTNPAIKNMDFYNVNNIVIIDRQNPVIPMDFFKTAYEDINESIYSKYKLSTWVNDIFEGH